jgi:hypothetical protein
MIAGPASLGSLPGRRKRTWPNAMLTPLLRHLGILLVLASLCSAGCGGSKTTMAPVRGTVSYRGVPLHSGVIVFTPDETRGTHGQQAHAEIQADGNYSLTTEDAAGALPGWHRITVVSIETPPGGAAQGFADAPSLLPLKYRDPDLSGLSREVKAGQTNVINLDLQ